MFIPVVTPSSVHVDMVSMTHAGEQTWKQTPAPRVIPLAVIIYGTHGSVWARGGSSGGLSAPRCTGKHIKGDYLKFRTNDGNDNKNNNRIKKKHEIINDYVRSRWGWCVI